MRPPITGEFDNLYQQLFIAAHENGITVREDTLSAAFAGFARDKEVVLHRDLSTDAKLQTLIHELAHVLLHTGKTENHDKQQVELEAESTTFVLMHLLGYEAQSSAGYILSWRGNAEMLQQSMQAIHYATRTIHGWLQPTLTGAIA